MRTPRVIFFDLDETLIVNGSTPETIIAELHVELLGPTGEDQLKRFMTELLASANRAWERMHDDERTGDLAMIDCFASAIDRVGGDVSLAETFFEAFLARSSRATRLSENAIETLEALRPRGIGLGIITNGIERIQQAKIGCHGLSAFVDTVVISEQAGAHKPAEKIFTHALARAGVGREDAWHVGDHPQNDVAGAMNAGLTGVFYDPSGQRTQKAFPTSALQPNRIINDLIQMTE